MIYRAEIDGLRALAVLPVILFHAGYETFSGGFVGVDVFFVISGYLITALLISDIKQGQFSVINFYERRARRLLPALFFVMLVCLPFAFFWLAPSDLKDFGQSLISTATFSSNIHFWWERGYFGSALELKPLLHTWSLAVEEQYYIIFPLFLALTWKLGIKKITSILLLIFFLSLCLAHFSSTYGVFERVKTGSFYLIPTRAWELLIGVFIALHIDYIQEKIKIEYNQFLSILGFSMILYSIVFFDGYTPFPSLYTLFPTIGAALVIIASTPNTLIHSILSKKELVFLGLISYSTYLWHQPIFAFTRHKFGHEVPEFIFAILGLISIFLGYLSWKWIEKPFRDKNIVSSKGIFNYSFAGILIFIGIGLSFSLSNGFIKSYSIKEQKIYEEFMNVGIYNSINMESVKLEEFDLQDERIKLLVIGDSYAEDLINAIKESKLDESYQLSSFRIPGNCGVLYIQRELIKDLQPTSCYNRPNFFNEPRLEQILLDADEIWIESSWHDWQLDFIKESLIELKKVKTNIVLFGSKEFGIKSANQYKSQYGEDGLSRLFPISERQRFLSKTLREISSSVDVEYIDPMFVICESYQTCKHSFDGKGIISVDGGHLTPYGARHFGDNLYKYIQNRANLTE
tara:strand:+ start:7159 stop:9048 length:1890 start_codon:yes stop_codon:yes gene_type:complete